jgi:hypothetical protein
MPRTFVEIPAAYRQCGHPTAECQRRCWAPSHVRAVLPLTYHLAQSMPQVAPRQGIHCGVCQALH